MDIYYRNQYILVQKFSTKSELEEYVRKYKYSIITESASGYDNTYEVISLSEERDFCVAIMYNWQGVEANSIIIPSLEQLIISFECDIVWVDLENKRILGQDILPLPIYTIKFLEKEKILVVIYEMGISVYDKQANNLWEMGTSDIIVDFSINEENISVESMDGNKVIFNTLNGPKNRDVL